MKKIVSCFLVIMSLFATSLPALASDSVDADCSFIEYGQESQLPFDHYQEIVDQENQANITGDYITRYRYT